MTEFEKPYTENKRIWKNDFVTRSYLREKGEYLNAPCKMSNGDLVTTVTFCAGVDSPYAYEIVRRTNMLNQYEKARGSAKKNLVLKKACLQWGHHLDGYGM